MTDHLAIDLYAGDGDFDLQRVVDAGEQWSLFALKIGQGTYYTGSPWAERMFPAARRVWGERYGKTGFRVAYFYLDCGLDGAEQAEFFLRRYAACGGVGYGDPFVMLDVERSGQRRTLSKQQVIDCAAAWVTRVHAALGLRVVIYGGEYLRALDIQISQFGCEYAWVAAYTRELPTTHYSRLGVDVKKLLAWQYGGVNTPGKVDALLANYPHTTPAGPADISALTLAGGGDAAIAEIASWCVRVPT